MSLRAAFERSWRKPNFLTAMLWPLTFVYRGGFLIKRSAYRIGLLLTYRAPIPVIVVGNLTVGGTGKTPVVIYLVEELRRQGYKPGVISRGYGGKAPDYPYHVKATSPVSESGDEPALIVRRTGVSMVVGADRRASIQLLRKLDDVDVIISDDGLQHFALGRDIEVCLLDATSPNQNAFLLPAGPCREPLSRLRSVDLIIEHGLAQDTANRYSLTLQAGQPTRVPSKSPDQKAPMSERGSISECEFDIHQRFHAVAGIGNPQRFFDTCRELDYDFFEHRFADHHPFSASDIDFSNAQVLMTEKDAVKCQAFADSRHWYLPVNAKLSEQFNTQLASLLKACL